MRVLCRVLGACVCVAVISSIAAIPVAAAGPLEDKASDYDTWAQTHHVPDDGYGSIVNDVVFDTETTFTPVEYGGQGDSTYFTGEYAASQAFRYAATSDPAAASNAIAAVDALHAHLDVTRYTKSAEVAPSRVGAAFIARYAAPATPLQLASIGDCDARPGYCHEIDAGPYAGNFWLGNSSRDAYTGWFYGMVTVYDLVDDDATRARIRDDVRAVVDQLIDDNWTIKDVDGAKTTAGPDIGPHMGLTWLAIAAHVTGDEKYRHLYEAKAAQWTLPIIVWSFQGFNVYFDYFAFALGHYTWSTLVRLEDDGGRRSLWRSLFRSNSWQHVAGTHNVLFDYLYLAAAGRDDADVLADARVSLADFPDVPNRRIQPEIPERTLDGLSSTLYRLNKMVHDIAPSVPIIFRPRTVAPRPMAERCRVGFMWTSSPYEPTCIDSLNGAILHWPTKVAAGVDYLLAYWLGRYHGFLDAAD